MGVRGVINYLPGNKKYTTITIIVQPRHISLPVETHQKHKQCDHFVSQNYFLIVR